VPVFWTSRGLARFWIGCTARTAIGYSRRFSAYSAPWALKGMKNVIVGVLLVASFIIALFIAWILIALLNR